MRLEQNDELAASYVHQFLGTDIRGTPWVGLIVRGESGGVAGCVVFNDYSNGNIEMTGVGRGCWTVPIIRELARYVFQTLGCSRVTARTAVSNRRAKRALLAIGFKYEGRMRDWFGHEDAMVFGLLRREQRLVK